MSVSITGERINQRRQAIGISADKLAAQIGVSRATLYRYENGDIEKVPIDLIPKIADALGVSGAWLLGWTDDDFLIRNCPAEHVPNKFHWRLRRARVSAGISREKLSQSLSIPVQDYISFESGDVFPDSGVIHALSKELGVSYEWLNCSIAYKAPSTDSTNTHIPFDPGIYQPFIDSALDPSEVRAAWSVAPAEDELLYCFRSLNPEGQQKAVEYVEDLVASGRYIKTDSSGVDQKEA